MNLSLKTAAASATVTRTEAKLHMRVDITTDDSLIDDLLLAATDYAENFTRRAFATQTWEQRLDRFPTATPGAFSTAIVLGKPELQSVTSIKYIDSDGVEQTIAASDYDVDTKSAPARITPAYGKSWPSARKTMNAITIEFVCGYAQNKFPSQLKRAQLSLIAHWYENREEVTVGVTSAQVPMTAINMMRPYQVPYFP